MGTHRTPTQHPTPSHVRSELDALLKAGVSPAAAAGGDAASAAPALAVGADGLVDSGALVEAVNRAAADVAAVRGQVAVMADRLGGKVRNRGGHGHVTDRVVDEATCT